MISVIEPLYKSKDKIIFGWKPETGAYGYRMYVGLAPASLTLLYDSIGSTVSETPVSLGKISYEVYATDVQAALSISSTYDFSNKVFYFAIIYVNSAGSWSALADSTTIEVPPTSVIPRFMKDDPSMNRHPYVFAWDIQKWVKTAGSSQGAMIVDSCDYYKENITSEYTYDGTNLTQTKSYLSDMTAVGSPAKLTINTYSGSKLIKSVITDSTV